MACLITIVSHLQRKKLAELPDYNAILKEGLVFKRLSMLKTSVTSGHYDKPVEDKSELKQELHVEDPVPADLPPAERKRRQTIRRLTNILTEPILLQVQNQAQAETTEPESLPWTALERKSRKVRSQS